MTRIRTIAAVCGALAVAAPASAGARVATNAGMAPSKNIVQTAVAAGQFKTLTTMPKQARLANTLQGQGRYTVFDQTDAAFARVAKPTLAKLAHNRTPRRSAPLYHVT